MKNFAEFGGAAQLIDTIAKTFYSGSFLFPDASDRFCTTTEKG